MSFFTMQVWGIHAWILIATFISGLFPIGVWLYFNRELIRGQYYRLRWPEKVVRVIMHYKGGQYMVYWRLLPVKDCFEIDNGIYQYSDKKVIRDNDFYIQKNKGDKPTIKVDGKTYDFFEAAQIHGKHVKWPEIHYFYNNPVAMIFEQGKGMLEISASDLKDFKENDLFRKFLSLQDEKNMFIIMMIIGAVNLFVSIFILAKLMGWIK